MKLADYKSVYMFDINDWGFTTVNFYLSSMTTGRKFRIVDTARYMNNSKLNLHSKFKTRHGKVQRFTKHRENSILSQRLTFS